MPLNMCSGWQEQLVTSYQQSKDADFCGINPLVTEFILVVGSEQ